MTPAERERQRLERERQQLRREQRRAPQPPKAAYPKEKKQ